MSAPGGRISIAILAMGGQGGGVLTDWVVNVAERSGFIAQSTSVPGVAQRTGATVNYVEIQPEPPQGGQRPVLALMPVPGDIDIVIAGELVESGRAVLRGFVVPGRTIVISSSHREYAIQEKMAMGDGRINSDNILDALRQKAGKLISFDMARLAEESGSVISAVLFGALAGSGALPVSREQFAATIRASGIAVEPNLAGFAAGFGAAQSTASPGAETKKAATPGIVAGQDRALLPLIERIQGEFPGSVQEILVHGVNRLIDYQDLAYAELYLDRLAVILAVDNSRDKKLSAETARYLALWMSFEDTIRVADLKTRASRFDRLHEEVHAGEGQIVQVVEFMHPRVEEICDTLPAGLGHLVLHTRVLRQFVGFFCSSGRLIRSTSLGGFLLLYFISALRPFRRRSLRYQHENAGIEAWLGQLRQSATRDPGLALELASCPRLVKGYGATNKLGMKNFHAIIDMLPRIQSQANPGASLQSLKEAALADESGAALQEALQTLRAC